MPETILDKPLDIPNALIQYNEMINTEKLKAIRERRGLSKSKLAQMAGMSKSYYWDIEHGNRTEVSVNKAQDIVSVLGVRIEHILEHSEIEKGNFVKYAGAWYEVAQWPSKIQGYVGIYDEPPSKHIDLIKANSVET